VSGEGVPENSRPHQAEIPQPLRVFRAIAGFSQEELGARAGINPATVGYLEKGLHPPRRKTMEALAEALNQPVALLFPDADAGGEADE